jgi:hypothetical protein
MTLAASALVRLERVTRSYDIGELRVTALAAADLTIGSGELVAITGPSGPSSRALTARRSPIQRLAPIAKCTAIVSGALPHRDRQWAFPRRRDMRAEKRVCVIGEEVFRDLFAGASRFPGDTLRAKNVVWNVVGVLKHKPLIGSTTGTNIRARKVLVPENTFDAVYPREHRVERVVALRTE